MKSTVEDLGNTLSLGTDFDRRTIYLTGEICEESAGVFLVQLDKLAESELPIRIVLMSGGGEVEAGFAIYDAIKGCRAPVVIDCYGHVASIATLILQAGTVRRVSPECRFMIHNGSVCFGESVEMNKLACTAAEVLSVMKRYKEILAERSGMGIEEIGSACDKESFFSAERTVSLGLADLVLAERDWDECLANPQKWMKQVFSRLQMTPKLEQVLSNLKGAAKKRQAEVEIEVDEDVLNKILGQVEKKAKKPAKKARK